MNIINVIVAWLTAVWAWVVAHPSVGVPVIGSLVVWATKKRTPEAYAAMAARWPTPVWSRLAALTQLASALFPDPLKARTAVIKLVFGIVEPLEDQKPAKSTKTTPGSSNMLPLLLLVGSLSFGLSACTPQARWALAELLAKQIACGVEHQDLPNEQIIRTCALDPENVPKVLEVVGQSRAVGARHAVEAVAGASAKACPGQ